MKLKEALNHIPAHQYLRLQESLQIVAMGYPESKDIRQHENKTVGLITVESGTLQISVYSK